MRAVFSHRPVPPIRVVASKKEKKAGSACTLDMIAELNRGVRGRLLVLCQHDYWYSEAVLAPSVVDTCAGDRGVVGGGIRRQPGHVRANATAGVL